ncbi:hypothetical protein F4808DRAFT_153781 [Astrocystis sublimbata]|nr:hypothetical protein F4808DRAFT_153781 [Astrocystis sublimbata]
MANMRKPDENHVTSAETVGPLPAWVNPDLERLLVIKKADGDFRSWAESRVNLPAGAVFARIVGVSTVAEPSWSSVQAGRNLHIELNSDLVFINHSCAPSLEWDMEKWEVRVSKDRDLKKGDLLSFFYPSTEFQMAQAFKCWCGAGEKCFGQIEGAAKLGAGRLDGYFMNGYIKEMLDEASSKTIENAHQT